MAGNGAQIYLEISKEPDYPPCYFPFEEYLRGLDPFRNLLEQDFVKLLMGVCSQVLLTNLGIGSAFIPYARKQRDDINHEDFPIEAARKLHCLRKRLQRGIVEVSPAQDLFECDHR